MSEHKVRLEAQTRLRDIRSKMLSIEYFAEVEKLSAAEKRKSAKQMLAVHDAYVRLRTANMEAIRESIKDNKQAILDGIKRVDKVLEELDDAVKFLGTVDSFLSIIARVLVIL